MARDQSNPPPDTPNAASDANASASDLVEGRDYYWDGGYMVLTAAFLQRRSYCCGSGCRHCPY